MGSGWLTMGLAAVAVACGGKAIETQNDDPSPPPAAAVACGEGTCDSSQVCVYPPTGCVALVPDAGVCPPGSMFTAPNGSVGGACLSPEFPPHCVRLRPGEGSFNCSGADSGVECDNVSAPIPERCGRICHTNCG